MTRIAILPEILSNKIAAGEVVERPASVVKELIENSLDAQSSRIIIEIVDGGRSMIRISDNGCGMPADDALLSIERYATSKIKNDPDLFSIQTLGFRGEALSSISSISRFTLITRDPLLDAATQIKIEGGRVKNVNEVGAPPGTMISVERIFFNTPARRKFLKSAPTEMGHIIDVISQFAIGWPQVHFKLIHNNKVIKNYLEVSCSKDRVQDLFGKIGKKDLYPVDLKNSSLQITGWIASPRISRSTGRGIYLYVNGRYVQDQMIRHALMAGIKGRLLKGRYPLAVIFVSIAFDQVDVNVHPTKREVRFRNPKQIHDAVQNAIAQALKFYEAEHLGHYGDERSENSDIISDLVDKFTYSNKTQIDSEKYSTAENAKIIPTQSRSETSPTGYSQTEPEIKPELKNIFFDPQTKNSSKNTPKETIQQNFWKKKQFQDLRIIGQFQNSYIICEDLDRGLILIDQHAAHERILFEQLKKNTQSNRPAAQKLILQETIELGFREALALKKILPELYNMGLEIEHFGGQTFVLKAFPALLSNKDLGLAVKEIAERIVEVGFDSGLARIIDETIILIACHSAIRANQSLSLKEISELLSRLDSCDNPSHCPHGRPTWIRWSINHIEKAFQRIK